MSALGDARTGTETGLPRVSVVIPTYQRRESLARVIAPLLADPAAAEVVVVVDGSTDGSFELLERMAEEDSRLRPLLIKNSGESGARLAGVQAARGEIVLLLDDDVEAAPGLVAGHARHHAGRADLLVVGYMPVRDPRAAPVRLYADAYEAHVERWQNDQQSVIGTLWAGNLSLRREAYLQVAARPAPARYDFHADRVFGFECEAIGLTATFDRDCRAEHLYERSLDGLARDAHHQGEALVRMLREYPAAAPELRRDHFTRFLPAWQAGLVEFARRPRADRVLRGLVRGGITGAEALGLGLAVRGADLLATLERQRGAIEASRG